MSTNYQKLKIKGLEVGVQINADSPKIKHTVFIPGWGQDEKLSNKTVSHLRKLSSHSYFFSYENLNQRVEPFNALIDSIESRDTTLVAHSEGALLAAEAALVNEKVTKVILINPSGLLRVKTRQAAAAAVKKFIKYASLSLKNAKYRAQHKERFEALNNYLKKHKLSAIKAARNVIKTIIIDELKILNAHKVSLHLIASNGDLLFPHNQIDASTKKIFKTITYIDGWHDDLHYQPEVYQDVLSKLL